MRSLVIKVTCGAEAPERLNQGFTVASVATGAGADVSLWLTGDAVWLAVPGGAEDFDLPEAAPLADLLDSVLAGGRISVCAQCAARRDLTQADLRDGIAIAGAAGFAEEILADGVQAIVY
ncbi:MAG: DsrE family protein [Nocardioides sp.]